MRSLLLVFILPFLINCQNLPKEKAASIESIKIKHLQSQSGDRWQSKATFFTDEKLGGTFLMIKSHTMVDDHCESISQHYMWEPESESFVPIYYPLGWPELGSKNKVVEKNKCKLRAKVPGPVDFT